MVIDPNNRFLTAEKSSLNGHHDLQYLDVTTTFTSFNSFTTFSKVIFVII